MFDPMRLQQQIKEKVRLNKITKNAASVSTYFILGAKPAFLMYSFIKEMSGNWL